MCLCVYAHFGSRFSPSTLGPGVRTQAVSKHFYLLSHPVRPPWCIIYSVHPLSPGSLQGPHWNSSCSLSAGPHCFFVTVAFLKHNIHCPVEHLMFALTQDISLVLKLHFSTSPRSDVCSVLSSSYSCPVHPANPQPPITSGLGDLFSCFRTLCSVMFLVVSPHDAALLSLGLDTTFPHAFHNLVTCESLVHLMDPAPLSHCFQQPTRILYWIACFSDSDSRKKTLGTRC